MKALGVGTSALRVSHTCKGCGGEYDLILGYTNTEFCEDCAHPVGARVLVCGSRDYNDQDRIWNTLDAVHGTYGIATLIEGEASGADSHARDWALNEPGVEILKFPADWKKYGKAAGPIRNKQMLVEGEPDIVYAFTNKPLSQSKGTLNMVTQARKAGIQTVVVGEDDTEYVIAEEQEVLI